MCVLNVKAFVNYLTLFSISSLWADAEIILEEIDAACVILTCCNRTHFDFFFTILTGPSIFTNAFIRSNTIHTFAIVQAWIIFAVVYVFCNIYLFFVRTMIHMVFKKKSTFAEGSRVTSSTFTSEFIIKVNTLFSSDWIAWI